MIRLRWWLARRIAPTSIVADPTRGRDGAFVMVREGSTTMTFRADRFRMKSRLNPSPLSHLDVTELGHHWGTTVRFVGTAQR